ncbi:MAG: amino acid adenylation domain-containing protein [Nocardiaceae bacterium]|nr:amino acid adenylation domain-containing protein [Nocardiaceae bacterium]
MRVGIDDSFFALGGDSILSIQLVARARARGVVFTPRDVFEQKTPGALGLVAKTGSVEVKKLEELPGGGVGDIPLLPVVDHFLEPGASISRFVQSMVLDTPAGMTIDQVHAVIGAVVGRHDVMRSKLCRSSGGWSWEALPLSDFDWTRLIHRVPVTSATEVPAVAATEFNAGVGRLDPANGVLAQFIWLDVAGGDGRMLVIANHLMVDGVSWRILVPDFVKAWLAVAAGQTPQLEPVGTSLRRWAYALTDAATADAQLAQVDLWRGMAAGDDPELGSRAFDRRIDLVSTVKTLTVKASPEVTAAILTRVPEAFHGGVTDGLLAALSLAVSVWRSRRGVDERSLLVQLEGHGREEHLAPGADLSQTVGWFTSVFPLRLEFGHVDPQAALAGSPDDIARLVKSVKERWRAIPDNGLGYGLLRHLNPATAELLGEPVRPQIAFNYLGRVGSEIPAGTEGLGWLPTRDVMDLHSAPDADRPAPATVDINAITAGDGLSASFNYVSGILTESDVSELTDLWLTALRAIADYASQPDAGGYSPSDFPLVRLTQDDVDDVERNYPEMTGIWPLAPLQSGLLFHHLFSESSLDVYTPQVAIELRGVLDVERLRSAVVTAIRRYPNLSAAFVASRAGIPLQIFAGQPEIPWREVDYRTEPDAAEQARRIADADWTAGFDLARPPLIRFLLITLAEDEFRLVVTSHHIVLDGWSMPLLMRDLLALYATRSDVSILPAVRPYSDYLRSISDAGQSAAMAAWRKALRDVEPTFLLREGGEGSVTTSSTFDIELDEALTARLAEVAATVGVTVNTILQTVWGLVLGHLTGREDVVFGTTVSGRPAELAGVDAMVGLFVNTIPVRVKVDSSMSVSDALRTVQSAQADLLEAHHIGLPQIQAAAGTDALFDTLLVFESYPVDTEGIAAQAMSIDGLELADISQRESAHYPLTLVVRTGARLHISLSYQTNLIGSKRVAAVGRCILATFDSVLSNADQKLAEVEFEDPAERARLVSLGQALPAVAPVLLPDVLARAVAANPDGIAVIAESGTLTYRQLDEVSNRLARALIADGVGAEDVVGLALGRGLDLVIAWWAVAKSGAAFVPIDPAYPTERIQHLVTDSAIRVGLTEDRYLTNLPDGPRWRPLDTIDLDGVSGEPVVESERLRPVYLTNTAYVIYTSGSTGLPKGVVVTHMGLANLATVLQETLDVTSDSRFLQLSTPSFDVSISEWISTVSAAATLVVSPPDIYGGPLLTALIEEHAVTHMLITPSVLASLNADSMPSLRVVSSVGEAISADMVERWSRGRALVNGYGPTETTVISNSVTLVPGRPVTIGPPLRGFSDYVLDAELRPVAERVAAEFYLGGASLARGYHARPGLTATRFVADPFGPPGARLYRTGDVVRWTTDADLEYVGRTDFQVKIRGQRIELGEVDAALLSHDTISSVVTVGRKTDDGHHMLVSYVVAAEGQAVDVAEVFDHIRVRLARHMVPAHIVVLEDFPLTPVGKIDRTALPAPETQKREYVEPVTELENLVADVFADVLGIDRVGQDDDFFDLGGNSLIATQVIARLGSALDTQVPVRTLFESPTVSQFALALELLAGIGGRKELVAGPRPEVIPLSLAQRRMWFLNRFDPESAVNNIPIVIRLTGELDVEAMRAAFRDMVDRHEVLRTIYPEVDGKPRQAILPTTQAVVDLDVQTVTEAGIFDAVSDVVLRGFDVTAQVPIRAVLYQVSEGDYVLAVVVHHISADGFSMGPLARDMMIAYAARSQSQVPAWAPLAVQYADFSLWQQDILGSEDDPESLISQQIAHWQKALVDLPEVLELPSDRPRPDEASYRGAVHRFEVSRQLAERLNGVARSSGASLFMVVHAALAVLLSRLSNTRDIAIGTPVAGRGEAALDDVVGMFVNTLVLRSDVHSGQQFAELLASTREADLTAYAHADVPFERLVELLNPVRSAAHSPLFQVMLTFQNLGQTSFELPGLTVGALSYDVVPAKFDLQVTLAERFDLDGQLDGIAAELTYATDLFDESTVASFGDRFVRILDAVATDPRAVVGDIDILDEQERSALLDDWTTLGEDRGAAGTIAEQFEKAATRFPDHVAVRFGDVSMSYRELDARANQLAHALAASGVGPEDLVAIALSRSVDLVVAIVGTLKSGAGYLPVDPSYPADRIQFVLSDARPKAVVTTAVDRSAIGVPADLPVIDLATFDFSGISTARLSTNVLPDNIAYVIYTSGSTGRPKGVQIPHVNALRLVRNTSEEFGFNADDVWTMFHSSAFDFSVWELWGPLLFGGTLVVVDYLTSRSPQQFAELVRREGVTVLNQTPSAFYQFVEADRYVDEAMGSLKLRYVIFGGEALELKRLGNWYGRHPETPTLVNMYGITETTVHVSYRPLNSTMAATAPSSVIGRAIAGLRVFVLDDRLQPVPPGVPGEMYVGGVQLARGYLGRPDLTAARFVADPHGAPGELLYRSGDVARYNTSGELEYLGRADDQVKVRGFRIELGEIAAVVADQIGVAQAVAIVHHDDRIGDQIVAYVVPDPGVTLGSDAVIAMAAERLPAYMVPTVVMIVDAIPLTSNGKLDRRALPKPMAQVRSFRAPASALEQTIADVFGEVLGVDRVGSDDDFFALGGNSLLATQVVSRIGAAVGGTVPVRMLFEAASVAGLATRLASHTLSEGRAPLVARARPEIVPLSLAQGRMWFLNQLDPTAATYNIPIAIRLSGRLDIEVLASAFLDVVGRHEVLRTVYPEVNGKPVQKVLSPAEAEVTLVVESVPEAEVLDRVTRFALRGFDVSAEVPVRALLAEISTANEAAPHEHVLVVVVHHISADGFSMGPLARDMMIAYAARSAGELPSWVPLPVQFADFALWQREVLGSEEDPGSILSQQIEYWSHQLVGVPDVLSLPVDRPRPPVATGRGATVKVLLPESLRTALVSLGHANNASMFMVLHAALAVLLSRLSGSEDIVIGAPVAGRGTAEIDDLVGMFVNTLALRTTVEPDVSFTELLANVRHVDLEAFDHADVPFERLIDVLKPPRSQAFSPVFQVALGYQNFAVRRDGGGSETFELPGLSVSALEFETRIAKFDLSFSVSDVLDATGGTDGLALQVDYATDIFDEATVREFSAKLERILFAAVTVPTSAVGSIDVISDSERADLLTFGAGLPAAPAQLLPELLATAVETNPDGVALVADRVELSYRDLDARSNRLARLLIERGIGAEDIVGIALGRGLDLVVAWWAVAKTGAAFVPIDPAYPIERIRHMVDDSRVRVGLTTLAAEGHLPHGPEWITMEGLEVSGYAGAPVAQTEWVRPVRVTNVAYVIYTSGSTGLPKGVALTHAGIANLMSVQRAVFDMQRDARVLQVATPSFDASVFEWFIALGSAATLVVAPPDVYAGEALGDLIRAQSVSHAVITPSVLASLDPDAVPSLRTVMTAGEAISSELSAQWSSDRRLVNGYGPTETTVMSNCRTLAPGVPVTIGRPIDGFDAYVLDNRLRLVPTGVAGELYIGGHSLARGYHGRPALTADRFVADPFGAPGGRLYRTGDVVRWTVDGDLEYVGRSDFQIKVRGQRIELGEIDAALVANPAVRSAVTVGHRDRAGAMALVSYVVGDDLDTAQLMGYLSDRLARHMLPAVIVVLESMPLTPVGKLDRKALPEPEFAAVAFVAPQTPTETAVAAAFAETLGAERVGRNDDFFALGGNSLLAVEVRRRLTEQLGQDVNVRWFFTDSAVSALAARIDHGRHSDANAGFAAVLPLRASGELPPLWCVHEAFGMGTLYAGLVPFVEGSRPLYALQTPALLEDDFEPATMEELARRYVDELVRVQPTGPYRLLGWSLGGAIAHAMAVELESRGSEVATVIHLDTQLEANMDTTRVRLRTVLAALGVEISEDEDLRTLADSRAEELFLALDAGALALEVRHVRNLIKSSIHNVELLVDYTPKPVNGDVVYVSAKPEPGLGDGLGQWRPYFAGAIRQLRVPFGHSELFESGALRDWAANLNGWLA